MGDVVLKSWRDPLTWTDRFDIVSADDNARFACSILAEADPDRIQQGEGLIRIVGDTRTVVYQLDEYEPLHDVWTGHKIRDTCPPKENQ